MTQIIVSNRPLSVGLSRARAMRRRWISLAFATLGALVLSSGVALTAQASTSKQTHRPPIGAIKLRKPSLQRVSGVLCGKVRGRWIPGTMVSSGYFLSDTQQAHNYAVLARHAKGRAKKTDLARSKSYAQRAKKRQRICTPPAPGTTTPPSGLPTPPSSTPTPLRFNLTGAIGLALQGTSPTAAQDHTARLAAGGAGSNLDAINSAGQISDAVTSGSASISQFVIAPSGMVYVLFNTPVDLSNTSSLGGGTRCVLAQVAPSSGTPTCVDSSLGMVNGPVPGTGSYNDSPIQFDSNGGVYYTGVTTSGITVLRRNLNGVITNLISGNVWLQHFLVLPDGTVIVSGQTSSTGAAWTRRISPSGSVATLAPTGANFLTMFPDGNVYMGLWGGTDFGVARYLPALDQMDSKYWISGSMSPLTPAYFDADTFCSGSPMIYAFCGWDGSYITRALATGDGNEFVVAGAGQNAVAMQYYPTVRFLPTQVVNVTVAAGVSNNNLVLAGLNANGTNVLTLYDTTSDTETQLIGPGNEIEIYHLNYSPSQNKVLFDGLRFSDNSYVIGEVDLNTDQVSVINAGSTKWADLEAFG